MRYKPNPSGDTLPRGDIGFDPILISAQYNTEKWTFSSEYSYNFFSNSGFGPPFDFSTNGESYYFQAAYRFAPKWELMGRYEAYYPNVEDESGKATPPNLVAATDSKHGESFGCFPLNSFANLQADVA